MSITLTKPKVSALDVVGTTLDLWAEFLAAFFDGAAHDVGANLAVLFPKPELRFAQSGLTAPSDQPATASPDTLGLTLVWNPGGKKWLAWETVAGERQQVAQTAVSFNFWIRATGSQARARARLTADRLHGLLANAGATRPLGGKGILRVRADEPRPVQDGDYVLLLVPARAQLRYPILSQVAQA